MSNQNIYVVTLHWTRAYQGRTVYVVRAPCPIEATERAIGEDRCHSWGYDRIEVDKADKELGG